MGGGHGGIIPVADAEAMLHIPFAAGSARFSQIMTFFKYGFRKFICIYFFSSLKRV